MIRFLKAHWHWIVLLLIPLIPLWRAVAMGEAIGPFDQIRQFAPWNGPKPTQPWDVLQADGVLQFYVWRDLVFDAWGKGQIPFWNPYELAGTPLLGNSQSGALYPPHVLMGVLHVPTGLAVTLLAWFHLFWAGLGVYKLVRALGGTQVGGVVAGASFALSPFMLSWTALSSVITTVCWIPWILFFVTQLFSLPTTGQIQPGVRLLRWSIYLAACLGMMVLGGHLQFAFYGGIAGFLLAICLAAASRSSNPVVDFQLPVDPTKTDQASLELKERTFQARPWLGSFGYLVIALVLGVLLAAPQLLPVLKHSQTSHRRNVPTEEGYASYSASAIQPFEAVGLVSPKLVGDPTQFIPNIESAEGFSSYWPQYFKQGANFAEGALGVGPVVVLLLFALRRSLKLALPIAMVGVVGLLLAFGTIFGKLLYFWLPGWSSTGSPGRAIVLFVLAACVLAGLAIQENSDVPSKARQYGPVGGLVFLGVLGLWFAKVGSASMAALFQGMDGSIVGLAISDLILPVFLTLVLTAVFGYLWLSRKLVKDWYWIPLTILVALVQTAGLVRTGKPLDSVQGPSDPFARVAVVNDNWGMIGASKALLPPNLAALSRIHELAGYDSLLSRDTKAMLDELNGQDSAPPANGNMMFVKSTADDWERLQEAGVAEVWSQKPFPGLEVFKPETKGGYLVYRLEEPIRVYAQEGHVEIVEEGYGRIKLRHDANVKEIVLRDRYMPGWSAGQNTKVEPYAGYSKGPWQKITPAPGTTETTLTYTSPGFSMGLMLGVPAWLVVLVGFFLAFRRSKEAGQKQAP